MLTSDRADYTIGDLARLAGVTPRTVRYYVAQGLLPAPVTHGPATRYGESHLARLLLVRRLQRRHLPLAEIRRQVERLDDREVRSALAAPERDPREDEGRTALEYIRGVLGEPRRITVDRMRPPPAYRLNALARLDASEPMPAAPPPAPMSPLGTAGIGSPGPEAPHRSQWERIALSPDIELHVRRPLSRFANRQVDRLIAAARDLIEEIQP
jgi:DNA-binding transcriptional MerR regulator